MKICHTQLTLGFDSWYLYTILCSIFTVTCVPLHSRQLSAHLKLFQKVTDSPPHQTAALARSLHMSLSQMRCMQLSSFVRLTVLQFFTKKMFSCVFLKKGKGGSYKISFFEFVRQGRIYIFNRLLLREEVLTHSSGFSASSIQLKLGTSVP